MSEPRGPFDDWLYLLAGELSGTFFSTGHPDLALEWLKKHLPIKLLEAAGKVEKHTVLSCFDCAWEYCFAPFACDIDNTGKACQRSKMSIRVLLEALPEKE